MPGYHFFIASEPRTTYIFAGGLSPLNTIGADSGVSCIAVTIFAIISMPLGDKGLSWRKAKESEGVEEWGSGGVGELASGGVGDSSRVERVERVEGESGGVGE